MRELRFDPVRSRWVIISTERAMRPNDYVAEVEGREKADERTAACPFCEGSEHRTPPEIFSVRQNGSKPDSSGWRVRVVPNKFPALQTEDGAFRHEIGMFDVLSGAGAHEVIVETPDHGKGLADLDADWIKDVLISFRDRMKDLFRDPRLHYVLIFKNYKAHAGASLVHSHSQLIATPLVPPVVEQELDACRKNFETKGSCLICDLVKQETELGTRVVYENRSYVIWSPFAPGFPFETWIIPKKHLHDYSMLDDDELGELAFVLKLNLMSLKGFFGDPPYNFVIHTSPPQISHPVCSGHTDSVVSYYHWHIELAPRLTAIAGFEWGTGFFINYMPPEIAANHLRDEIKDNLDEEIRKGDFS